MRSLIASLCLLWCVSTASAASLVGVGGGTQAAKVDATGNSGNAWSTTGSSISWTHVVGTGATVLVVGIGDIATGQNPRVSSVFFGAQALTLVVEYRDSSQYVGIWYLASPTVGSNTVSATFTTTNFNMAGGSLSIINAGVAYSPDAYALPDSTNSCNGTGTSATCTDTVVANGSVVFAALVNLGITSPPTGITTGQTSISTAHTNQQDWGFEYTGPPVPAGGQAMTFGLTFQNSGTWREVTAAFAPEYLPGSIKF